MWEDYYVNKISERARKMTLTGKERGELIKLFFVKGKNAAGAGHVYQ